LGKFQPCNDYEFKRIVLHAMIKKYEMTKMTECK
jgi:hypothetical protein